MSYFMQMWSILGSLILLTILGWFFPIVAQIILTLIVLVYLIFAFCEWMNFEV